MLFLLCLSFLLNLWHLSLQNKIPIIVEDLIRIHHVIEDKGLKKWTPSNHQKGITLVLENW